MSPLGRSVPSIILVSLAALLSGCDACQDARDDAVRAWDAVVSHALDVAAEWGETEVKDSNRGRLGISETAERERKRWVTGLEKAKRARDAMVTLGPDFMTVVNQTVEELGTMEPRRANQDWQDKLANAKKAAYLVQTVCRTSK